MRLKTIVTIAAMLSAPSIVLAHGPKVGANGGVQADAGNFHVEVVSKGTVHDDKVVEADNARAAIERHALGHGASRIICETRDEAD